MSAVKLFQQPMHTSELIHGLIKNTFHRAVRESVAALLAAVFCACELPRTAARGPQYYGCLMILISAGVITGVVWSFAPGSRRLRSHPVTDAAFWHEAFRAQARLLRLIPAWYLAPLCTGMLLFSAPIFFTASKGFLVPLSVVGLIFGGLTWLNRLAAAKLDENARRLMA